MRIAWRRLSSKSGNEIRVGQDPAQVAQVEPLPGEVLDERARPSGRRSMRRTCAVHDGRLSQLPAPRTRSSSLVGNRAPEEERQARRQLEAGHRVARRPASASAGSSSGRNTNDGLARIRRSDRLDAGLERARRALLRGTCRAASVVSAAVSGRRNARRPSVADDATRTGFLVRGAAGRQRNTRRLAGCAGAVALNGPVTVIDCTCGARSAPNGLSKSRMNGCSRAACEHGRRFVEQRPPTIAVGRP